MKKRLLLASLSLGGLMFAQTPTYTETKPVETAPVSTPVTTTEPTTVPVVTPVSVPGTFSIGADFRTRAEFDNGQRTLIPSNFESEATIFSRARLNFEYKKDKLSLKFAPQAIRVWGETASFDPGTNKPLNGGQFEVYEAWAQYAINPTWGLKVGRMPLSYDDERLFGALDWQMAGRNFDVAKLIYTKGKAKFEVVGGYNNDNSGFSRDAFGEEIYTILDGAERTKSLQIMHYENSLMEDKFKFSFIAVHNVVQNGVLAVPAQFDPSKPLVPIPEKPAVNPIYNSLFTFGFNPKYKINDKFAIFGSAYYQGGRNTNDISKKAFQLSGNLEIKPTAKLTSTLGAEILSGSDDVTKENNSFSPFYGTNHKFNGYMDYFYVGNHFNGRGLNDFYLKSVYKATAKGTLAVNLHGFMLNKELAKDVDKFLGTEIDLVYTQKVADNFNYQLGYSQMMGNQDTMKALKGLSAVDTRANQSWAWVQLNFSPKIFSSQLQ
jgi:hypothetical protein